MLHVYPCVPIRANLEFSLLVSPKVRRITFVAGPTQSEAMHGWKNRMLLKRYLDHGVSRSELSLRFSVTSDAIVGEDRQNFGPWRVGSDG